jgi:hypothetical protein
MTTGWRSAEVAGMPFFVERCLPTHVDDPGVLGAVAPVPKP